MSDLDRAAGIVKSKIKALFLYNYLKNEGIKLDDEEFKEALFVGVLDLIDDMYQEEVI